MECNMYRMDQTNYVFRILWRLTNVPNYRRFICIVGVIHCTKLLGNFFGFSLASL